MVPAGSSGQGAGAWAGGCADREAEADLSLSFCVEGRETSGPGRNAAGNVGLRRDTGDRPTKSGSRRGRGRFDVRRRPALGELVVQMERRAGLESSGFAWSDGSVSTCPGV